MREKIAAGNIYHVLNRGVDKRNIFLDEMDYLRFIHNLFEFNDTNPINNGTYRFNKSSPKAFGTPYMKSSSKRKLLVEILAFCLMPNHYHLLIKPRFDDGLVKFIKRLNMGYAMYFNEKYQRKGALFEGRYKAIRIVDEPHFIHIPYYIHLNPLDFVAPEWRKRKISDWNEAINFLSNYRWSSFSDYIGKSNFPSVTSREFLQSFFKGPQKYKQATIEWLKNLDFTDIKTLSLE